MVGDRITEETPLLQGQQGRSSPARAIELKKRTLQTYAFTFGFLAILTLLVYTVRSSLPTPLSDTAATRVDGFPGIHAYEAYLSKLTEPHPVNSRANIALKAWLDRIALEFQAEGEQNGVKVDVITNDSTIVSTPNEHWFVGSRNLIVRVHGQSGSDEAILLNAHYDSVPTSYGVTDDGMGVVVELELLRYFVKHPPQKTIIFLFNNFEEGGLIGAKQFVKHPWFKTVKLFLNLEGAGAGGRALLFRCSSLQAAKILGSNSPQVHATPLGNDMFRLGLLKSDTDYTILEAAGVPGMDIAFYAPRSHYHTPLDNLENVTPDALQHMGQMVLATLQAIDKTDGFFDEEPETQLVYYDVLGKIMFAYNFTTHGIGNMIALVLTPLLALVWTVFAVTGNGKISHLARRTGVVLLGFIATLFAFVVTVLFVGVASAALYKMNPLVTYGNIIAVALYMFLAGLLGVIVSQLLLSQVKSMRGPLSSVGASFYGLTAFWWILLIFSSYAGSKQVAVLYFAMFSFIGNVLACILYHGISPESRLRLSLAFLAQIGLPFTVMVDQTFLVMDSMRHSTVDGTPEIAVYGLVAIPVVLMAIQLQPWINTAGQKGSATLITLTALVLTFAICCVLQPFNNGWSPNKVLFSQEYNSTSGLSTVAITAAAGIPTALQRALPVNESDTIRCEPFGTYRTRCYYETDLVPIYADEPNEMSVTIKEKQCVDDLCRFQASFTSQNSLLCRIQFNGDKDHITNAWAHGLDIEKGHHAGSLVTYSLQYGDPVEWGVEYRKNANLTAAVGCFYDEWSKGQLPAFTYLHEHLDDTMTLLLRGQGLSFVYYDRLEL
ncbi:hypothetical protein BDA99DRAFT_445450 [Phascolomyces articulosus]|uniref:Peptide hydrolase n=1 Tax=Phascolomyces articulosus TaxID=60185 RepID=A0AAD5PAW8_9FUNG|nr:hypothetical protein BDA99DRAFT_445450 [Phascolomyces articulosus]